MTETCGKYVKNNKILLCLPETGNVIIVFICNMGFGPQSYN
jgi:hypothetical protein